MPLAAISPFGPIFSKELRVASRRKRNYLLRVLYLGGLLLFLLLAWSITRQSYGYAGVAARQQQQEQLGGFFFMFFSMFSVCAMGLIGPVLTSTAINGERDAKTLHVLLMTPLSAWQIVSGKLFSRLLTAMTLIGLSLPVLALVRLLGGVELEQMLAIICLSAVVAMVSAALGLLLSIMVRRAYAVILLSYLLMGVVYLFAPMMLLMLWAPRAAGRSAMGWVQTIAELNPFWCAGFIANGQMRMWGISWVNCFVLHVVIAGALLVIAAVVLRRLARREGEGAGVVTAPKPALLRDEKSGSVSTPQIAAAALSKRKSRAEVSDHPILWRELRRPLMASRWQRIVGSIACLGMLLLTYAACAANNQLGQDDTQIGYAWVFFTLLMLLACVLSATSIAQEKEGDQWLVLLASPLSGSAIVWGKAIGVLRRMLWPMMLVFVHFLIFRVAGVISPATFLMVITIMVLFNVIWIATGVTLSLLCRKVTIAVIINLALPVALYGALSMVLAVADELLRGRGKMLQTAEWWIPYYFLGEGLNRGGLHDRPQLPGPDGLHDSQWAFLGAALTAGLVHLAVASALLGRISARFNKIVGRARQTQV
jgi:ABC-type transport system involved in multi-copper enzyme maturation permease subunit